MVKFSTLILDEHGNPVETDIREIKDSDIAACPHYIMVPEHYRSDGTCYCNDPAHTEMAGWGYVWDAEVKRWRGDDE